MTQQQGFHDWYFGQRIHRDTFFNGVPVVKAVSDLWAYQEVIHNLQPKLMVELGVFQGGFTLYLDMLNRMLELEAKILSVDLTLKQVAGKARQLSSVEFLQASTLSPEVPETILRLREELPGPMFLIVDDNHHAKHVRQELDMLRGVTKKGDYVVVEDTNISRQLRPKFGPGPAEALADYMKAHPGDYVRDTEMDGKFGFTFAPGGWLVRQ